MLRALNVAIALETKSLDDSSHGISSTKMDWAARLWRCVESSDLRIEVAMLSGDGQPLISRNCSDGTFLQTLPRPHIAGAIFICPKNVSASWEGWRSTRYEMSKSITGKEIQMNFIETDHKKLRDVVPADSAVVLSVNSLEFKLLATVPGRVSSDGPTLGKAFELEGSLECHP